MFRKSALFAGTASIAWLVAFPATAQTPSLEDRVRAIEQMLGVPPAATQNRSLEERVEAIENQLRQKPAEEQQNTARINMLEMQLQQKEEDEQARATRLSTLEQQFADTTWTFDNSRPTIQSADGRFLMAIRARFQFDSAFFNQSSNINASNAQFKDLASGSIMRRAYIGIEGRVFRDFWYEYRMDFGGSNAEGSNPVVNLARISWNLGNIAYPAEPHFRINAGLIQPIFTYDDSVSSSSLTFLERAAPVNVATSAYGGLEPRRGVELTFQQADLFYAGDNLVVSAAYTGQMGTAPGASPDNTTDEGTQILGRVAYRVWSDGFSNVQIGGSASHIVNLTGAATPGGARTITLQDRPELRVDGNRLVSTGAIPATGGNLWGAEFAANLRNFYLTSEYLHYGVDRNTTCAVGCVDAPNPSFYGWYVQGSWIITGETKTYQPNATNNEMATFNNPRVITPFSWEGRTWGAWEIAARYSDLNLNWNAGSEGTTCIGPLLGCIRGGEQKIWTFGLNWYLNNTIRMMFDYMLVDVDKLNSAGQQIGQNFNAIGVRLQFSN